ncbi:energy transducer TonB [Thioalkalivibrio sp. XN8]|uniref:energy transducer TonB n=1 Tax=Thioalkalivibrio sp. XN8 TaxID=2712863 RepID=UPI0013E9EECC|nr:energy transducer TonB [Thioalkalivibrio sp. XN8]NGP54210.1 energy transducer TonB [Thioalkalivibrio sp. XN8]
MLGRYAIAVPAGLLVTLLLVIAMQALIAMGNRELDESQTRHFVDFVQAQREEVVERKDRKPEKPPEPSEPPPDQPQPRTDSIDPVADSISIAAAPVSTDVQLGGIGLGGGDGDYLPIVKVAPVYPQRALARGIEGYVVVEFTVTRAGTVTDVSVLEAEPPGMFEEAARNAALKFKYKPRVVDGEAIEVHGVQNRITFQLER